MENATKAMLIAAGLLIGVMIMSLGVALYNELANYVASSNERIMNNEINTFNTQYTKYLGKSNLTIQDVVTVANMAFENNNNSSFYIEVYLNGAQIESEIQNINSSYYISNLLNNNLEKTYTCNTVDISDTTARVYKISFQNN